MSHLYPRNPLWSRQTAQRLRGLKSVGKFSTLLSATDVASQRSKDTTLLYLDQSRVHPHPHDVRKKDSHRQYNDQLLPAHLLPFYLRRYRLFYDK